MAYFIAGLAAGITVTLVALAAVAAAVNRGPAKREQVRLDNPPAHLRGVHLDGVDVTRYLDATGRNGGTL